MALHYFSGRETFLKKKELKKLYNRVNTPEFNWMEFHSYSAEIADYLSTPSFMGGTKYCILWFFPETELLLDCFMNLDDDMEVFIVTSDFPDYRKKVTASVLSLAEERKFDKISEMILIKCIVSRLKQFGYTDDSIQKVSETLKDSFHVYLADPDMDLEEVRMHVDMIGYAGTLNRETVMAFSPKSEQLKGYRLSGMLLDQNPDSLAFAWQLLEQGEPVIGILSLILYQIRVCYKAVLYQDSNCLHLIGIRDFQIYKRFTRYNADTYKMVYRVLNHGINRIKQGEWQKTVLSDSISEALSILRLEFTGVLQNHQIR